MSYRIQKGSDDFRCPPCHAGYEVDGGFKKVEEFVVPALGQGDGECKRCGYQFVVMELHNPMTGENKGMFEVVQKTNS